MSETVMAALITAAGGVAVAIITLMWRQPNNGKRKPPPATRAIEMSGRWQGGGKSAGWVYDFVMHLQAARSEVRGHIDWTLRQCPPNTLVAKYIGSTGAEFVRGSLEGNQLTLSGYETDNPKILTLADYAITFRKNLETFDGTTIDQKDKTPGTLHGQATARL